MVELLSNEEVEQIRKKLGNNNRRKLEAFQGEVVAWLGVYVAAEGQKHVRFVIPRPEIKNLKNVVDKINKYRRLQKPDERPYDLNDINDLVGAKILCPYPSDVQAVLDWLYTQRKYNVKPSRNQARKEMEEKERDRGYRGYNFVLRPRGREPTENRFELQVKTLTEEAWDAKTHGVSYKPTGEIEPQLLEHMRLLSKALVVIDDQSEVLKNQIKQEEAELELDQRAAVSILLSALAPDTDKRQLKELGFPEDPSRFQKKDSPRIYKKIKRLEEQEGLSALICRCYALLGVCDGRDQFRSEAEVAASHYASQERNWRGYRVLSHVHWGLGNFEQAIEYTGKEIELLQNELASMKGVTAEDLKLKNNLEEELEKAKNEFVYWVCEAKDESKLEQASKYLQEIDCESSAAAMDTLGFFKIVFGKDRDEIDKGREFIKKAVDIATSSEKDTASSFYLKHERLALRQLHRILDKQAVKKQA